MAKPQPNLNLPGQRQQAPLFGTDNQKLSLKDVFGPQFEGAVIMRQISLNTEDIRRLIRRDYLFLSKMLHTITRTREFRGINPGPLNRIEEGVETKITSIRELIATRRIEVQKRFNKKPDATIDVTHSRTTTFEAPIASPHSNAYLDLLLEADEFLARMTACWLQGLMKSQEYHGGTREIKRALHAVKADVTAARAACFKMLHRISEEMPLNDPESAKIKSEIAHVATDLVADANADSEVMDAISVSDGHDLSLAARVSTTENAEAPAERHETLEPAEPATS